MDNEKKKSLIKSLLSGRLTKRQRKAFADLVPVDIEIKNQWNKAGNHAEDLEIKEQIWKKIKAKCEPKKNNRVLVELRWYMAAAFFALLLTIGGVWFSSRGDKISDETIKIVAEQSRLHILPDSTKVWMEAGSSIKYAKAFNQNREVWLEGNSLFEVCRHEGTTFKVYITKAYIEVKGTFFHVKQQSSEKNEITLFNGKIEFNVEATGEKTIMKPLQKIIYNPTNAQTELTDVSNLNWENGKYTFTNTPLQKLIQIINQMYDADIVLSNEIKRESAFTGSIRYDESLEDVLSKVCFTLNLRQENKGNHIIIKYQ